VPAILRWQLDGKGGAPFDPGPNLPGMERMQEEGRRGEKKKERSRRLSLCVGANKMRKIV